MPTKNAPPKAAQDKEAPGFVSPTREPESEPDAEIYERAKEIFADDLVDPDEKQADIDSLPPPVYRQGVPASPLHAKLADLRANFGFIGKTGANTGIGYQFVEATEVARRFVQEASARGLTMVPIDMKLEEPRPSASGKQVVYTLAVMWRVTDAETGEFIEIPSFGQGADQADKALPKAQTNAMKYAILLLLQAAGDDPENDPRTDQIENTPQGPGVNIGDSNIPGVIAGGRQNMITQPQLDAIRQHARRLDLNPESFAVLIGSALGGKTPEIDDKENTNDQQRAIIAFCGELSFAEAGTLIQALTAVTSDPEEEPE